MADRNTGGVKKRNRVALSCAECRTRKLKCDRKQPCNNCTSRGLDCTFASGTAKASSGAGRTSSGRPSQNEDLRYKLQRLEEMVSLMAENNRTNGNRPTQQATPVSDGDSSSSPTPEYESRPGHLIPSLTGQHYIGPSNWETILHDIADIREHLDDLPSTMQDNDSFSSMRNPMLLRGVNTDFKFNDLLLGLPSRQFADRLMERFFSAYDPAVPSRQMLHKPTFLESYENFWQTKDVAFCPFALGSYYAIFCLALQSYYRQDDEPPDLEGRTVELAEMYKTRAAQCALKADLTAPTRPSLECLILSAICEYSHLSEGAKGIYLLMGIIIRKSLIMGLHRDPEEFTTLSPFEKELRRRLWAHIRQMDLLFSFHLGVPNTMHVLKTDVAPPCNVYEEELTPSMKSLPPPRPADEFTPINFTIVKLRLQDHLEPIIDHLHRVQGPAYEQVDELSQKLETAIEQVPHHLRVQPVEESLSAPKSLRLQRLQVQLYCDKAVCMLNRRYLSGSGAMGPLSLKPRARCINAALRMLEVQERLEQEQMRWWLYHLTTHDFLLATTILYLALFTKCKKQGRYENVSSNPDDDLDDEDRRIFNALRASRAHWSRIADQSKCARQACRIFDSMECQLTATSDPKAFQAYPPAVSLIGTMPTDTSFMNMKLEDTNPTIAGMDMGQLATLDGSLQQFDWDAWDTSMKMAETYYENGWL